MELLFLGSSHGFWTQMSVNSKNLIQFWKKKTHDKVCYVSCSSLLSNYNWTFIYMYIVLDNNGQNDMQVWCDTFYGCNTLKLYMYLVLSPFETCFMVHWSTLCCPQCVQFEVVWLIYIQSMMSKVQYLYRCKRW